MTISEQAINQEEPSDFSYEGGGSGVEYEDVGITNPFDPSTIKVETKQTSLDTLIKRIKEEEINLSPDFQRNEVWGVSARSRLIESLLIRIPLPAFYMDATDDNKWLVVDGLQRLSALRDFIIPGNESNRLILTDLEFLKEMEGKGFKDLPRNYQRRIEETQVTVYLIEKGTPNNVKFNIFKRINTGGLPLTAQEIRHALYQGPVTSFLKELAESKEFQEATAKGIRDQRMLDRECVLRFFAFVLTPYSLYTDGGFDDFLGKAMVKLNRMSDQERDGLKLRFYRTMSNASKIFSDHAFRKPTRAGQSRNPINKALFEAWSVNLDRLSDEEITLLENRKNRVTDVFIALMNDQQFANAISQGTGKPKSVCLRFERIERLIRDLAQKGDTLS